MYLAKYVGLTVLKQTIEGERKIWSFHGETYSCCGVNGYDTVHIFKCRNVAYHSETEAKDIQLNFEFSLVPVFLWGLGWRSD